MTVDRRCGKKAASAAILICLFLVVNLSGCGRAVAPSATLRYVRIEPLLAYHPSWKQLAELEKQVALIGKQGDASSANAFILPDFPASLPPNVSMKLSQGVERQSQIERDARQYAEGLNRSLSATNRILIGQERRREQKRVEKELGAKLLEAENILREVNLVKQFAIMEKIKSLSFQQAILLSQINVYLQVTRSDNLALSKSQLELKAVVNEIEGLNESLRNLKNADLIAQSNSKRAAILKSLEAMSSERLAKRQSDLDADKAEKVAEALQVQKLDPVPIPQTEALPSKSVASVLTLPEKVFLPGKNTEAALAGVSARNRLSESSRQQRDRRSSSSVKQETPSRLRTQCARIALTDQFLATRRSRMGEGPLAWVNSARLMKSRLRE